MNDTPRTSALLRAILDRDGQVGAVLSNAPEEWVTLCRELERELAAVSTERNALTNMLADARAGRDALLDAIETGGLPHSCSDGCTRPVCVVRRQLKEVTAKLTAMEVIAASERQMAERIMELEEVNTAGAAQVNHMQGEITQLRAQVARLKLTNAALVRDLRREMERNEFREAAHRVAATLENTPL